MSEKDVQQAPWTVGRLLEWTTNWFKQRNVEGGRLAAELLLARALGCKKIELYTRWEQEPSEAQRTEFRELVKRAGEHTPIAYLLGVREFYSLDFIVTPAVLIPRPDTEALVQRAIELCRAAPDKTFHILDIGTGSGCIAVAIARYAPNARLVGSDVSAEALQVAAQNVEKHKLGERVRLAQADLAAVPDDTRPDGGFDIIVTNPPYISDAVWKELAPNVRDYEPKLALTGPGGDGLAMYRRLAEETPGVLAAGGTLLAEIGHDQRDAVREVFESAGGWTYLGAHRSRTDPHDRVLEFRRA